MSLVRVTLRELGATALAAAGAASGAALFGGAGPARWGLAGGLAIGLLGLQLALRRGPVAGAAHVEASRFLEQRMARARSREERPLALARGLAELLASVSPLGQVRIFTVSDDGDHLVAGEGPAIDPVPVDRRARAWIIANPRPIERARLSELPAGGLRLPIERLVVALGGDLVLPLVHHDRLVGMAIAYGNARRAMRGSGLVAVEAAQQAAASALEELLLRDEADRRAGVEREVERAGMVHVESDGDSVEEQAGWRVVRRFSPARQFSGAWWTTAALPGPRLLVALGEVTGRGVPAALLSASAIGVCQAAARMLGSRLEPQTVLELVHGSLHQARGDAYRMSCFVAVLDAAARAVSFAGAGHPFPYVWRAAGGLGALVSRGNLLGGEAPPRRSAARQPLAPGDVVLFYSASATDARSPDGEAFGERRLRRLLLDLQGSSGAVAERVEAAVRAHVGEGSLEDDLLVAAVSAAPGRRPL
ncbi:MAG TPA: PP2C family protein-serine/threonine phosphatase [Kofleriaceae bacterium]|nr:PP2C family protein-serine/threonine phosphatase [Kofleriaceae bacterium]